MSFYQLKTEQLIPATIDSLWKFISDPRNLEKITPKSMGFKIRTCPDGPMYPGMIIEYQVKPLLGIPTRWVTEITIVKEKHYFVDEQRVGPYAMWHHEHILETMGDKTKMTDIVSYKVPFGIFGKLAHLLIIRRKLNAIFSHRKKVLENLYPENESTDGSKNVGN